MEIVKLLFEHNVDIDAVNDSEKSAFCLASENEHVEVMILLLKKMANIHLESELLTALDSALEEDEPQIEVIETLLRFGANANMKGPNGNTALQHPNTLRSPDLMRVLLEQAENLNLEIRNKSKNSVLELALKEHRNHSHETRDILKMILFFKCYN